MNKVLFGLYVNNMHFRQTSTLLFALASTFHEKHPRCDIFLVPKPAQADYLILKQAHTSMLSTHYMHENKVTTQHKLPYAKTPISLGTCPAWKPYVSYCLLSF